MSKSLWDSPSYMSPSFQLQVWISMIRSWVDQQKESMVWRNLSWWWKTWWWFISSPENQHSCQEAIPRESTLLASLSKVGMVSLSLFTVYAKPFVWPFTSVYHIMTMSECVPHVWIFSWLASHSYWLYHFEVSVCFEG